MQALRDDIASRLVAESGQIGEESGNVVDGFKIKYAIGNSQGTVAVEPLKNAISSSFGSVASGSDKVTVSVRICINEEWFLSGTLDSHAHRS